MYDIQYQERTNTLTDREILKRIPQLVDDSTLTEEQKEFLRIHKQKYKLLEWLHSQDIEQRQILQQQQVFSVSAQDIEQTRLRLETLYKNIKCAADDLLLFEREHSSTIKSLICIGLPLIEAEEREKNRKLLEEWRRKRDDKFNTVPTPITDNLRVSESQKAPENTSITVPQKTGVTIIKDKLINALGSVGLILWYLLSLLIAVMPFVMIHASLFINLLLIAVALFIPATSGIFWIWGLVCAIRGSQDALTVIYYVLFVVMFLPYFVNSVRKMLRCLSTKAN